MQLITNIIDIFGENWVINGTYTGQTFIFVHINYIPSIQYIFFPQVLQQTMPAPIFHLLLKKLPEVSERLRASMKASGNQSLQEEDVE